MFHDVAFLLKKSSLIQVNEKYTTKYRSPGNKETILSKLLPNVPIRKMCALIGTVMLGLEIPGPLEDTGQAYRLHIILSAAYYCFYGADLSEILDTDLPVLLVYLKGIFQAACRVVLYALAKAAQNHFELNIFKPAIKNAEIQAHLDLGMSKGVLGLRYNTPLHYTIAHLYRAYRALPQHLSIRKALDLLDVRSPARFCCMHY